jgi:hypothetical protein
MIYSGSKLAFMEPTSMDFLSFLLSGSVCFSSLNLISDIDFVVAVCLSSWAIIASKFKDKTTRQCRRRLVSWIDNDMILCFFEDSDHFSVF